MKKILVVDDHKDVRDLLSKVLISNGYEVDSARDGMAALRQVEEKRYDLVITDYRMPGMNGLDLLKRLKMDHSSLPVLMITASGIEESFFKQSGADASLTKPIDISFMNQLIKKILNLSEE